MGAIVDPEQRIDQLVASLYDANEALGEAKNKIDELRKEIAELKENALGCNLTIDRSAIVTLQFDSCAKQCILRVVDGGLISDIRMEVGHMMAMGVHALGLYFADNHPVNVTAKVAR